MWRIRRDPRVRDEIRFHRDRLIEDYVASGMARDEAERRAVLEFGSLPQVEEAVRDVRGRLLDDLAQDLRYAARTLRHMPAFSAVAVLSLALAIGANVALFSIVNATMLRSLPVREPGRLVHFARTTSDGGLLHSLSYPLFEHFRDNITSISGAFAQTASAQSIVIDGDDDFVTVDLVSGGYFNVLALEPAVGRLLVAGDDVPSPATPAAVISDRYWQRRFGRSASAIGRTFTIRSIAFTIVGVTPASYEGARAGSPTDVILPLLAMLPEQQRKSADFNSLNVLARLKPGATLAQANAEAQVLYRPFIEAHAARSPEKDRPALLRQRAVAVSGSGGFNPVRDNIEQPLFILLGVTGLILLLACVNLSGLLLARAAMRHREISIRLAIGAGRGRLARQLLTESLLLAAVGAVIGLALAYWLGARLLGLFVAGRDLVFSVAPDWRVLLFTMTATVLATVAAGLMPALRAMRVPMPPGLKDVRAQGPGRLGKALVAAQLAISMVVVVGATLFIGTLVRLYSVDRGFDTDGVLVVQLRSPRPFPADRALTVQQALVDRVAAVPGVRSVSAAMMLPIGGGLWDRTVQVEGYTFRPDEPESVAFNAIAPGYFATLGTPLLAGREFTARDTAAGPKVAIVNESFARYFFGDRSPIGGRVTSVNVPYEIVGVVRDAKYQSLRDGVLRTMYIAWTQRPDAQPTGYSYLARVSIGDAERLAPVLDRVVRDVDPSLRVRTAVSYATIIGRSIATERIMATLGGLFGLLALVVAALGVFGVLAFQAARRTNEFGVRMALGANRWTITILVLRDLGVMAAAGVSVGAAVALIFTGVSRKILFGVEPTDPAVFIVAASVLTSAAVVAGWLPARRASRVDPAIALRHE